MKCAKEDEFMVAILLKLSEAIATGFLPPFEIPENVRKGMFETGYGKRFLTEEEVEKIKASGIEYQKIFAFVKLAHGSFTSVLQRKMKVSERKIEQIMKFIAAPENQKYAKRSFTAEEKNKILQLPVSIRNLSFFAYGNYSTLYVSLKNNSRLPVPKIQKIMDYVNNYVPPDSKCKETKEPKKYYYPVPAYKRLLTESESEEVKNSEFNFESLGKIIEKNRFVVSNLCAGKTMLEFEKIEKLMYVIQHPLEYEKVTGISEYKRSLLPEEVARITSYFSSQTQNITEKFKSVEKWFSCLTSGTKISSQKIKQLMKIVESNDKNVA